MRCFVHIAPPRDFSVLRVLDFCLRKTTSKKQLEDSLIHRPRLSLRFNVPEFISLSKVINMAQKEYHDALVVGTGFAGLYSLHLVKQLGLDVKAIDSADDVGGTWYCKSSPHALERPTRMAII